MQQTDQSILRGCRTDVEQSWRSLVLTDVAYKIISFVLLTPAVGFLSRLFISVSGREVLADEDILFFVMSPIGVATLIVVGAVALGVWAFEQSALMTIAFGRQEGQHTSVRQALVFAASRAFSILLVTARLMGLVLLTTAPFLVVAGVVYRALLTEYDINYYLHETPPAFLIAIGIAGLLVAGLLSVLIPMLAARSMALPLLLFEGVSARDALRISCDRTAGHRIRITSWLIAWGLANFVLSAILSVFVAWLGRTFVHPSLGSLQWIIVAVGVILSIWLVVNVVTTLIGAISLAVLQMNLYRKLTMSSSASLPESYTRALPQGEFILRLTRRTIVVGSLVAILFACTVGAVFLQQLNVDDQSSVMAHRGSSAAAPENTLAAVAQAIKDEADWVEIDVQESADGVVVVAHDRDLKKAGGSSLKIWESTAEQLRQVDIGSWFSPEFADQRVPTLDEVLEMCKGRIRVNIELKYYGHDQHLEQRVIERVKAHGMDEDIVLMSLKKAGIDKIKRLQPDWPAGLLTATAIGDLSRVDVDFLAVNVPLATRGFIRAVQARGKRVFVWTVNDPLTLSTMMGRGVDSIITDKPAMAAAVKRQRLKMSPIERLFIQLASVIGSTPDIEWSLDDA